MRKSIIAALTVVSLTPSLAWAADVTGTINAIDQNSRKLTLDNGKTYQVEPSASLAAFKPGDKVTVSTSSNESAVVDKITKAPGGSMNSTTMPSSPAPATPPRSGY